MQVLIVLSVCVAAGSALTVGVRSSIFDCPTVNVTEDFDLNAVSSTPTRDNKCSRNTFSSLA